MRRVLTVDSRCLDAIIQHGETCYPLEAAGVIVSGENGQTAFPEISQQERNRFNIKAATLIRARQSGDIIGFYHSHPDGRAALSIQDARSMRIADQPTWPGVAWVVLSVINGRFVDMSAYMWNSKRRNFSSVAVVIDE
ncbi:MAG: Mov34/MPN/PAD-1 family protein [Myxococcota bacterium]|nr:Mov34/MPN/PAD-1 family protein [Myxococcota bacterium]